MTKMNAVVVADDKMAESEPDNTSTILDYLNEDCWRAVLDYLPIRAIIRSEGVCKRWQMVVLVYLRGARIGIEHPYPSLGSNELHRSVSWVLVRNHRPIHSFEKWTNKLGSSLVSTYCGNEECLRIIGENCPNLEAVKFMELTEQLLRNHRNVHFGWLQRICFIECPSVSDRCIIQYATSQALQELEIHRNIQVTGYFLRKIKSDLKSLVLNRCSGLESRHLNCLDRFTELAKLVLNFRTHAYSFVDFGNFRSIHFVLRNLRKLEHLEIFFNDDVRMDKELTSAVCELKRLRHLGGQVIGTDDELLAVIRCCRELRSLDLENCDGLTSRGVSLACRAAPQLTALGFHQCGFTDDDVAVCIRDCPDLTSLDVRRCRLTRAVMARAAAARQMQHAPRPLHLYIDGMIIDMRMDGDMDKYEELILHF